MRLIDAILPISAIGIRFDQCRFPPILGLINPHGHNHILRRHICPVLVLGGEHCTGEVILVREGIKHTREAHRSDRNIFGAAAIRIVVYQPF